jgi:diaminopimelate epimerase
MPAETARPRAFEFLKMQGTGNDFVLIDARFSPPEDYSRLSVQMCNRHRGIGADGLLVLDAPNGLRMQMWNPDGSLSEMCGNGLRCFAKYALDEGISEGEFPVETGAGRLLARATEDDQITISLGRITIGHLHTPLLNGLEGTEVSVGNPHVVIFVPQLDLVDLDWIGPQIENLPRYPHRTNVHFAEVISDNEVKVAHWERGAGRTLACGTGMVATVAAGFATGRLNSRVQVNVPGGRTFVSIEDDTAWLTGHVEYVFRGTFPIAD